MRLRHSLLSMTKAELSHLRTLYELKNISNLKKDDLVERMAEMLPGRFPAMLERIGQAAYDVLRSLTFGEDPENPLDVDEDCLEALAQYGLAFTMEEDGRPCLYMPDELGDAFVAADGESLRETVRRNTEWAALTQGMLHYYGVLDVERIRQRLEELTGKPVPFMELLHVLTFVCAYQGQMELTSDGFCDIGVLDAASVVQEHARRPGIPFRHFDHKQLMAASVPDFLDRTPEMRKFLDFIRSQCTISKEDLLLLALDVQDAMRAGARISELMQVLQQWIAIPSERFLNDVLQRLMTLYNATRQWAIKGHTPVELRDEDRRHLKPLPDSMGMKPLPDPMGMKPLPDSMGMKPLPDSIGMKPLPDPLRMTPVNGPFRSSPPGGVAPFPGVAHPTEAPGVVLPFPGMAKADLAAGAPRIFTETAKPASTADGKVGRNDPCPCGSGKKYKKCCMGSDSGSDR